MVRYLVLVLFSLIMAFFASSQTEVCIGSDVGICEGETIEIDLCNSEQGDTSVVFLGNINTVNLTDDDYSQPVPIGFNFTFYGTPYNEVLISSNGYITFDIGAAGGFSPWTINDPIPNPNNPLNAIMGPWHDYNPNNGGVIGYTTIGNAPNRQFVVVYKEVFMFGDPTEGCSGIVLHEGSDKIEIFLDEKPIIPGWNNGASIQGIQNQDGTIAHAVNGRNFPTQWAASLDGRAWLPDGPNNYDIFNIPYRAYVIGNSQLFWRDTEGNQYTSNGNSIEVTPNPSGGTNEIGYFVNYSSCAVNDLLTSDTTWVTVSDLEVSLDGLPDECTNGDGEITATVSGGEAPISYQWDDPDNQTTATATGLFEGTYTVNVSDALGCTVIDSFTVEDDPIQVDIVTTMESCAGAADGSATVSVDSTFGNVTYLWSDSLEQTTHTATGLTAGTYEVIVTDDEGCSSVVEVEITTIPEMIVGLVDSSNVTCNGGNDGQATIEVTQGTAPYSYEWDVSGETTPNAEELVAGSNNVLVTDANGCQTMFEVILGEPDSLRISFISEDVEICREDSVLITAQGEGGSSPYTFTWIEYGQTIAQSDSVWVNPEIDLTNYCVILSEQCGSPEADTCMTVTFPEDIIPSLAADTLGTCIPTEINFTNTTESDRVATTIWHYGDSNSDTLAGLISTSHTYTDPGVYDVSMEVTSTEGCKYEYTYNQLIYAYRFPEADMYFNPSPVSIFDPIVRAISQTTPDVVTYEWFAPAAIPDFSTEENPLLRYPAEEMEHEVTLVVENEYQCRDTAVGIVRLVNEVQLFAPNSFTPDGDEFNDRWRVYVEGIDILSFHLIIYNRWGKVVFESFDPEGEWDGTYRGRRVPEGTFIWRLEARDRENDEKFEVDGYITVIR